MIERVLRQLAAHGVDLAVLSMGYLPDPFLAAYPSGRIGGVEVTLRHRAPPRSARLARSASLRRAVASTGPSSR